MFKQLFRFKADGSAGDAGRNGSGGLGWSGRGASYKGDKGSAGGGSSFSSLKAAVEAGGIADHDEQTERSHRGAAGKAPVDRRASGELQSFEEIYRNAPVKPPKVAYSSLGILRVVDMVHSPHLAGMSPEAKRNSVLMALDVAGVKAEDLLQDAMVRQRALNDYEESQESKLRDFETSKEQENVQIRTELDRLSAAHLGRIQENLDLVARHQDNLRMWVKRKEEESEQIAEAASFCSHQSAAAAAASGTPAPGKREPAAPKLR